MSFLTAEWRKLIMANYAVDSNLLQRFLPAKTELDFWNNTCYVSLVGFMFLNTRLKGIKIPFHINFEEVNLRFYVRFRHKLEWRRGVVFIKEIVPKPALTFVANTIYKEKYETLQMKHVWKNLADALEVEYSWKKGNWSSFKVVAHNQAVQIEAGSEEEFITEHYWGYTKITDQKTSEYQVEHPRWLLYPIKEFQIDVDFTNVYGLPFGFLKTEKPKSVFLAEGSEINVHGGKIISN
ncbi:MAG: DUF2071 domain-containing protein [Cyclobacteriaceae bacterium]|nr:DUF2071 domain-containing protein [Cyclobacteriaceae bacterium]